MMDINLLKQIFGDNVITISSPEEVEEKMKAMADFFKKAQPKDEEEHDCSKCKMPQNLCFVKPETRDKFKVFAVKEAARSITRIIEGPTEISDFFTMSTILRFTNPDPEVSGLKPTLKEILEIIKEGNEKVAARVLLGKILLYLWCNNK